MVAEKISTEDIQRIGRYGELKVTLPDYAACMSAKSIVTYTKNMYPREDGLTYKVAVDRETNTITITTVDKEK
jgi:hypothetical protein